MEDTGFAELEQAAVAGAEGTAWTIPEFGGLPLTDTCYTTFSTTSPFSPFPTDPAHLQPPVKDEPAFFELQPPAPSSPLQPSLCSVESEQDYAHLPSTTLKPCPTYKPLALSSNSNNSTTANPVIAKSRKVPISLTIPTPDLSTQLFDLKGTTAARSRKMTEAERKVMLLKRRLRNRASAARSREKRSKTLTDLTSEVENLMSKAKLLAEQAKHAADEARKLKAKNVMLLKENELLKSSLKI